MASPSDLDKAESTFESTNNSLLLFDSSDEDSFVSNKRITFGEIVEDSLASFSDSSEIAAPKTSKKRINVISSDSEDEVETENQYSNAGTSFTEHRSTHIDSDEENIEQSHNSLKDVSESDDELEIQKECSNMDSSCKLHSSMLVVSDEESHEESVSSVQDLSKSSDKFQLQNDCSNMDSSFKLHRSIHVDSDEESSDQSLHSIEDPEDSIPAPILINTGNNSSETTTEQPLKTVEEFVVPSNDEEKAEDDVKAEDLKSDINKSLQNLKIDAALQKVLQHQNDNIPAVQYCSREEFTNQAKKVAELRGDTIKCRNLLKTLKLDLLPDKGSLLKNRLKSLEEQLTKEDGKLKTMVVDNKVLDEQKPKLGALSWAELQAHSSAVVPRTFGVKAMATHTMQKTLTMDRLKNLTDSLATCPEENISVEDPKGLKVSLMPHQKRGLAWLLWRESQKPSGGILADDMGLGKTLSMISLIIKMKELKEDHEDNGSDIENEKEERRKSKIEGGTLVICPATLIGQWEGEITKRCRRNLLTVEVHHGLNRDTKANRLAKYDVVITTYKLVMGDHSRKGPLYGLKWRRIILDEAHVIRNHKSQTSLAICDLTAKSRWALTGTPIHNKELDLYSLLKFLRCTPFDDLQIWKRWVDNKNAGGQERLNTVMATIMLRRTKEQLLKQGTLKELPERKYEVITVQLDPAAKKVYQKILIFSKTLFVQFLHQRAEKDVDLAYNPIGKPPGFLQNTNPNDEYFKLHKQVLKMQGSREVKSHEILVLLLRLRQICCHPSLIVGMLNDEYSPEDGIEEDGIDVDILDKLNNLNIDDEYEVPCEEHRDRLTDAASKLLSTTNPVFDKLRENEKIQVTKKIIMEKVLPKGDKVVVVSQWTGMLQIVAEQLQKDQINFTILDGKVPVAKRNALVENFNNPSHKIKVLLLSLTAGGVGLNLVGANHLILLDLHWNPQLESQAQDRIYRFGQQKSVFLYKIVTIDTIEERIKALQENKLSMANDILTGTRANASKLSLNDLKMLFSINDM